MLVTSLLINFGISRCLYYVLAIKSRIEYVLQSTFAKSTSPYRYNVTFYYFRRLGTRACYETFTSRKILVLRLYKRKTSRLTPKNVSTRAVRVYSLTF